MSVRKLVRAWFGNVIRDEHHRYRSWEHCYCFFRRTGRSGLARKRKIAALQLGFFLASWGMYRGSSFLLRHAFTIHTRVVDVLRAPGIARLWEQEFGSERSADLAPIVHGLVHDVRDAYSDFGMPTDTLVTKVLLGTLGCLPACDRYFLNGFTKSYSYSYVNQAFVSRLLSLCQENLADLRKEQAEIERVRRIRYPLMKLVDMYFYQLGGA